MASVTVPATLESLQSIGRHVLEEAERAGLDKSRAYRLRLAVDEVATNIITHGGDIGIASPTIDLTIGVGDDELTVVLEDTGPAYDPLAAPKPEGLDRPLAQRAIGGLGVYLAIRAVDRFTYERVGGRNRNVFTMHRT